MSSSHISCQTCSNPCIKIETFYICPLCPKCSICKNTLITGSGHLKYHLICPTCFYETSEGAFVAGAFSNKGFATMVYKKY